MFKVNKTTLVALALANSASRPEIHESMMRIAEVLKTPGDYASLMTLADMLRAGDEQVDDISTRGVAVLKPMLRDMFASVDEGRES